MANISQAADKAANRVGQAGRDIWEGTKAAFKKAPAGEAVEVSAKAGLGTRIAMAPLKATWHVVTRPVVWGTELAGLGASKLGAGFKAHPRIGLGIAAVGVAAGVGHHMNKRAERDAQGKINELEMAQMRTAQAQAQANTVTPAEYAAMEARMRQGGANGGFAAGLQAERAAASNTPAV